MSEEKKIKAAEQVKGEARRLTEDELVKVNGGTPDFVTEEGGSPKEFNFYSAGEIKDFEYKK